MNRPFDVAKHVNPLLWFCIPWGVALFVFGAFYLAAHQFGYSDGRWFFLLSLLLFGLPHGASDALLAPIIWGRRFRWLVFIAAYLLLVGLVFVAWQFAPSVGIALFILLTAWHWGSAETALFAAWGDPRERRWRHLLQSWSRGGWVMLAPLAFHPAETEALLNLWEMPLPVAETPLLWVSLWSICMAFDVGLAFAAKGRSAKLSRFYGLDALVLIPVMAVLPPLWWIGLYFMFFHAWRHGLRLTRHLARPSAVANTAVLVAAGRLLTVSAWKYWLAALGLLVPLAWMRHGDLSGDPIRWVGDYLVLLAALTVPHALLIKQLDRFEGQPSQRDT